MSPSIRVAVIAAGAMGSGVARVLTRNGVKVLTNLDNRSEATKKRAREAGMQDASFKEIGSTCDWVLSILPPSDAFALAEKFLQESAGSTRLAATPAPVFVDCNAVNPATVHRIADLFEKSASKFIDAGSMELSEVHSSLSGQTLYQFLARTSGPPSDDYNPTFYASAGNDSLLDSFVGLSKYGLKVSALKGEGAGIGDASALKMSYAGITKGTTALFSTMILAAHQSSPATADALLNELHASQPFLLKRITSAVPPMVPKAYRWVGEMEEIAGFVGEGEGEIYHGISKLYSRIEKGDAQDLAVLANFVDEAKKKQQ
ncbi:6-phosphogluconate dehydrogenase C-terminal domain-like protein [Mycena alexandri]|uniref:6-phosphogluconate dehydrogenase C-terminal domain-like protein n=1 Tax=Mycena alexandri TaxID=1745969 RepID=A0AAD6T3N9_9AGAR|nr:6-phosphogluconate dehydrogenase C-terminal domain-like protein [Mycena alexandri]